MALLEAKAACLKVVAGYTLGVATIISEGETSTLRPQGDGQAFTAALHRLLHDARMRETIDDTANRNALQ